MKKLFKIYWFLFWVVLFWLPATTLSEQYGELHPENTVIALWHLNGDALDATTNNHDGTVYGATSVQTGYFGQTYDFDGNNDYISVSDSDDFTTNTGTLMAWIYLEGWGQGSYGRVFAHTEFGGDWGGFELFVNGNSSNDNYNFLLLGTSSSDEIITNVGSLSLSQWHHIAVTWDGSNLNAYVDGEQAASPVSQTVTVANPVVDAIIGRRSWEATRYFDGKIEELCIWNRALSSDEIKQLYGKMKGQYSIHD